MASVVVVPSSAVSRAVYVAGISRLMVYTSQGSGGSDSHTKTVNQPAHGLIAPCITYLDIDGRYKLANRSDPNKHGTILVVSSTLDTLEIATVAGEYDINFEIGNSDPNSLVYLGSIPGSLSLVEPTPPINVVILGKMRGNRRIFYSPDWGYE